MRDLNALVGQAVDVLSNVMAHGDPHERLAAAVAALTFAASLPAGAALRDGGCQHANRVNLTTMGGGPVCEGCTDCGAQWVDGAMVPPGGAP